jgi:hypothetical protein
VARSRFTADRRHGVLLALSAVVILAGVVAATVMIVRFPATSPVGTAHWRPPRLSAPSGPAPLTVSGPGGRRITCPTGSEPAVMITQGEFVPSLFRGTTMNRGKYLIRLRGSVNNETGAAVDVRKLLASVRGRFWSAARITVAPIIAPQSSVSLIIEGRYLSVQNGPVAVRTHLDWRWHDAGLAHCGDSGLIPDD